MSEDTTSTPSGIVEESPLLPAEPCDCRRHHMQRICEEILPHVRFGIGQAALLLQDFEGNENRRFQKRKVVPGPGKRRYARRFRKCKETEQTIDRSSIDAALRRFENMSEEEKLKWQNDVNASSMSLHTWAREMASGLRDSMRAMATAAVDPEAGLSRLLASSDALRATCSNLDKILKEIDDNQLID